MARIATELPWGKWFEESGKMLTLYNAKNCFVYWVLTTQAQDEIYNAEYLNFNEESPESLGEAVLIGEIDTDYYVISDIPEGALFFVTDTDNGAFPDGERFLYGAFCDR